MVVISSMIAQYRRLLRLMGMRSALAFKWKQKLGIRPLSVRVRGAAKPLLMRPDADDFGILNQIFLERELDVELPFCPQLIVDGGANVGYASAFFANKYPKARIISIEPSAANFEMLKKNIQDYKNIHPIRAGLWSSDAALVLDNPGALFASLKVREAGEADAETFPGISIPGLMASLKIDKIDLLKLDIEGTEERLFTEGNREWISNVQALVIEIHGRSAREAVYGALEGQNFRRFEQGERTVFIRDTAS